MGLDRLICTICGDGIAGDPHACANKRCFRCHIRHCLPGGNPGEPHGSFPLPFLRDAKTRSETPALEMALTTHTRVSEYERAALSSNEITILVLGDELLRLRAMVRRAGLDKPRKKSAEK